MGTNAQQQASSIGPCYLSSHWVKTSRESIVPAIITKSFKKCFISNYLDGTEDVLWVEQHNKSDSDEEGDNMYDEIQQIFSEE